MNFLLGTRMTAVCILYSTKTDEHYCIVRQSFAMTFYSVIVCSLPFIPSGTRLCLLQNECRMHNVCEIPVQTEGNYRIKVSTGSIVIEVVRD